MRPREWVPVFGAVVLVLGVAGCRQDMHDQAKYKPYRASKFFADGRASRPLPEDTVARGRLADDTLLYTGKAAPTDKPGAGFSEVFPFPVTAEVLARGRERYDVYCSPCHDRAGSGGGMIVQRGYRRPPSFHIDRLRQQPVGYLYDVIRNGFGAMPNYAQQIPARDRWAIVAYVRALQLSQNAGLTDVPPANRPKLSDASALPAAALPPLPAATPAAPAAHASASEVPVAHAPVAQGVAHE